ncbi:hydrolase [Gordonia amarae]|uniref:NlpC/P60 family protein n=2 Tax=Gordonia amarae TaxID=36821 RepID=G7GPQ7_9ACTN|nr:C40 family peptidase [Gordonia amarae]MCS3879599.1 cell wall-associated NlpC family hydrolase [Gordonia amarae]QHN18053.1 hydrolase [Gordonia amarae]QHN22574.1 hydrolase [Gordonia amarae]QHN31440.1 hydrolase [Gordonia amarae]QHN40184.1 hydrolase [Gordonia amarae]
MAKHRLEQPARTGKLAKSALIAGSLSIGSLGVAAGAAEAAPVTIPNVGTFEIPGISEKQIPKELRELQKTVTPKSHGKITQHGPRSILAPRQTTGEKAVRYAATKIGSPYSYGAAGPSAFDCSGLVYWSYQQAGKTIPRDSYGQLGGGQAVNYADAKPGDVLIFNGGGHAGIYEGNGIFIHSSTYGVPVQRAHVKQWDLVGVRRY